MALTPTQKAQERVENGLCRIAFWLQPRSLQIPCLHPSFPSFLTFLSPHLPSTSCFQNSFSSHDSAFPSACVALARALTDKASLFLRPQVNFPRPVPVPEHEPSPVMVASTELGDLRKSIPPALSVPPPHCYPPPLFSLHLSHSVFQNVAIEKVAPNTTFLFAFGFRHPEGKRWTSEGERPNIRSCGRL